MVKLAATVAVVLACVALPTRATAQVSLEQAIAGYHAWEQIQREVWLNNPNEAEMVRHAGLVLEAHGLSTGIDLGAIDPTVDPQGWGPVEPECIWREDENGEWVARCSDWHTYGPCYGQRQIGGMKSLQEGAWWFGWFYTSAAIYAYSLGNAPVGTAFGVAGQVFSAAERLIGLRVQHMEARGC